MKFKNIRRPPRAAKAGIVVEPLAKKLKLTSGSNDSEDDDETSGKDEYDKNVLYLKKIWHSKKWSLTVIMELVEQTANGRRKWIIEDCPPISEVLACFSCFADPRIVSSIN